MVYKQLIIRSWETVGRESSTEVEFKCRCRFKDKELILEFRFWFINSLELEIGNLRQRQFHWGRLWQRRHFQFWFKTPLTPLMLPKDKTQGKYSQLKSFRNFPEWWLRIQLNHLAQLVLCWSRLAGLKWRLWKNQNLTERLPVDGCNIRNQVF